jgi:hypothetical protein
MHNRQGLTFTLLWEALTDYDLWPIYILGITWSIPPTPTSSYLTLILKGLGWNTFEVNLLTISAYVLFLMQLIFFTWLSEKIENRFAAVLFSQFYMLPLVIGMEVIPSSSNPWARYTLSILLIGYPYVQAILGIYYLPINTRLCIDVA